MSEILTTSWRLDTLFKRAEKSREEAERWFRFQKRFDASRRTEHDPAGHRVEAAPPPRGNDPLDC